MNDRRRDPAPRAAPAPARPPQREARPATGGEAIFGLRASLAVFERRPDDISAVAYHRDRTGDLGPLFAWAKSADRGLRQATDAELEQLSGSNHHEGVCLHVRARRWTSPADLTSALLASRGVAVALDRVRNPYNVGAILRTAAFFGIDGVILGAPAPHPALAPDAVRVAEGGAEAIALTRTTDLPDTLARIRSRGVRVVGADGASPKGLADAKLEGPIVLVLGHEREGLGLRVHAACDTVIAIRGSGKVESLNVAVAAGVLMAAARSAAGAR